MLVPTLERMRIRLQSMRTALIEVLERNNHGNRFRHLLETRGMFALTGFNARQIESLRDEFAIYLVDSGRLCFSGLNANNVEWVAGSLAQVSTEQNLIFG
jgi:aromatic-amino-acid transaminase